MSDFNPRLSDLDEVLSNQLKAIVEQQNCLLMSFISPKPVKTSPIDILKIYKKWVLKRLEEPRLSHIIECFAPIEVRQPSGLTTAVTSTDGSSDEKRA